MIKIFFLILLLGGGLFLFNLYDPFDMKLFDEEKEVVVETKKPVEKKALTAKDFFLKGKENLKSNNYKMAISNFSRTLELDPNYVEAYKERALAKDKSGDFEGSKKDYEKYILMLEHQNEEGNESKRNELKSLIKEINKKVTNKQYNEAVTDLSNIIDSYSKYPEGYVARGDVYFILKKYKQALDDYQKASSFGDKTFVLYLKLANTKYELGLYQDSIKDYLKILNLDSNYEYAYYKLTGAYIFTEDFNAALKSLNNYVNVSSTKNIKTNDYEKWIAVLNKYTENETIRDLKSDLKKLRFI